MKKEFKNIVALLFTFSLTLSLCSCSEDVVIPLQQSTSSALDPVVINTTASSADTTAPPVVTTTFPTNITNSTIDTNSDISFTSDTQATDNPQTEVVAKSTNETEISSESIMDNSDTTPQQDQPSINKDLISELGMTYNQLVEKYGEPKGGFGNTYSFEGGYGGRYAWKSLATPSKEYDSSNIDTAGGCNIIDGVKPKDLFLNAQFPIALTDLEEKYGFQSVSIADEYGMYDLYSSEYTHSSYPGVTFTLFTKEYMVLDTDTSIFLSLDVDCEEAVPVSLE